MFSYTQTFRKNVEFMKDHFANISEIKWIYSNERKLHAKAGFCCNFWHFLHWKLRQIEQLWRVKRICVFEHSVMTNFNCSCPAIQRGQGSGFLSEGSSWLAACMSEQRRFWQDCTDALACLNLRCSHRWYVENSLGVSQSEHSANINIMFYFFAQHFSNTIRFLIRPNCFSINGIVCSISRFVKKLSAYNLDSKWLYWWYTYLIYMIELEMFQHQ